MNAWDLALIVGVATMGTSAAYLRNPEHKVFVLMLPFPFTLAVLSLGRPIDGTNLIGLPLQFVLLMGIWALHVRWKVPIVLAIVLPTIVFCLVCLGIARRQPTGSLIFWCSAVVTILIGVAAIRWLPYWEEPHYRTPLPVWIKLPAIALVVIGLVLIKQRLGGFMTTFPMVSVVVAYESRHSLWTMVRRFAWVLVLMTPMIMSIRLWQDLVGVPVALLLSWPVLLVGLWLWHTRFVRQKPDND